MAASLEPEIGDVFARCQSYYLDNEGSLSRTGSAYAAVREALTAMLEVMALLHAELYRDQGYKVDKQHPGYLIKSYRGLLFRIPYHVLPTFPSDESLPAIWDLSRKIRNSSKSTISISGSNVLRKLFEIVGDIDFCEYFRVAHGFDRVVRNLDGDANVMCLKLTVSNPDPVWKWDEQRPTADALAEAIKPAVLKQSTFKMDYVGDIAHFGITEISNIVIALDGDGKSAGLVKTHAGQEVPLTSVDWLPNQMNDPIDMGRYIDWLARAIKSLQREGDMRKCLKRCASLSRILYLPRITDDIAALVDEHRPFLLNYQLGQLQRLCAMLNTLEGKRQTKLAAIAEAQQTRLSAELETLGQIEPEAPQRFANEAHSIANRLLTYVQTDD